MRHATPKIERANTTRNADEEEEEEEEEVHSGREASADMTPFTTQDPTGASVSEEYYDVSAGSVHGTTDMPWSSDATNEETEMMSTLCDGCGMSSSQTTDQDYTVSAESTVHAERLTTADDDANRTQAATTTTTVSLTTTESSIERSTDGSQVASKGKPKEGKRDRARKAGKGRKAGNKQRPRRPKTPPVQSAAPPAVTEYNILHEQTSLLPSNLTMSSLPGNISVHEGHGLSVAEAAGVATACLVVFWLLLGPLLCFLLRGARSSKQETSSELVSGGSANKRRADRGGEGGRGGGGGGSDGMSQVLMEEMIRMELARGRAKRYRTSVHDERELQRLPMHGSPAKHASLSGLAQNSPSQNERLPFALSCMSGSGSLQLHGAAQSNLCYDGTPSRQQLEQLQQLKRHVATSSSEPSSINRSGGQRLPPSVSLPPPPPPPLPPRIPLRRKLDDSSSDLTEKATQTPPWTHRTQRPVPKPRKTKSPRARPRKPPRKTPASPVPRGGVPRGAVPSTQPSPDDAYVDCMPPIMKCSPQRLYNFDKGPIQPQQHNGVLKRPADIVRVPCSPRFASPLLPRGSSGNTVDTSSEEEDGFHSGDDSLERRPWPQLQPLETNRLQLHRMGRRGYVAIHDTKL
ncbi:hypothetical protein CAPTEDRAFT_225293 [Capitella teleta]|uniref:Uncharacterized protein n=1 Tax=Capitella teleta TaxID=283909 RepID=R7TX37_CAPTE|nr:hypothetical protein CAPTEDRAFT_225293 [Capitella teleta]|eukprot:ELT98483.1 hypothetical protein CAPTEDRAFT_225293 [Capitella teleta]